MGPSSPDYAMLYALSWPANPLFLTISQVLCIYFVLIFFTLLFIAFFFIFILILILIKYTCL